MGNHLQLRPMDIGTFVDKNSLTEFARYSIKDTGKRQLKVEIVMPGFDKEKHKGVFRIDTNNSTMGPQIEVYPRNMAATFPITSDEHERILSSLNYPPSEDEKYVIQAPIQGKGKKEKGGDPHYPCEVKEEKGIVTLIWDIMEDTGVDLNFETDQIECRCTSTVGRPCP